jgi:Carboxypeptidase regulatory-like domain
MKLPSFVRVFTSCLLFITFSLVAATESMAQQTLGTINGTVTDSSSAAVPDATISVTGDATGLTRSTKSQKNGYFEILNLPIGLYTITITHEGFDTTRLPAIAVQEARASTISPILKVGQVSESVTVNANPMLNATDTTNGYTLDAQQIAITPLATGSFTQLAVLAPGVSAELLSGLDSNAGLGNQPIWANGQRDTSNTFQVNGVDTTNLFNGKSSSGAGSQRINFNIGGGSTSSSSAAGSATIGGANPVGTSVYGSNGNSLPSPPPEFLQELRVNTSMYDAQQGATSGAQIDANTATGSNSLHGQIFGNLAGNGLNASPYFFNQQYILGTQGVGAFPESLRNPALHRWTTGATIGGPIFKNKLFYFLGYERLYSADQSTGLTQMNVPSGLTNDRSPAGLAAAEESWSGTGKAFSTSSIGPIATGLLNAKLADGSYLIPSAQVSGPYQYGVPNVTLIGTSRLEGDHANAAIDYNLSATDHLSVKYYYQRDPVTKPYGLSATGGFPTSQENGSQVVAIGNTTQFGSHINWEQRLGFARMGSYSYYTQNVTSPSNDPTFGIGAGLASTAVNGFPSLAPNVMPGLLLGEFAANTTVSPALKVGPYSSFSNIGFYQNRVNPSTNLILSAGKHTFAFGGGYNYTQLNITNDRTGLAQIKTKNFMTFLEDTAQSSSVLDTIDPQSHRNNADRYYRSNEITSYAQDKWQVMPNLSITAGVRYDYHGGLTEKYGNMFNFDPSAYGVTGDTTAGFNVTNSGFVVAGNNKYNPTAGVSNSTLDGRQWGISPRLGFAWAPEMNHGKVVWNGGVGMYYDRGELFSYLSQPAGSGNGGPFGVTESAPLSSYVVGSGKTMANPFSTIAAGSGAPGSNPAAITSQLQSVLNGLTGDSAKFGKNCGAVDNQEGYTDCPDVLNFGAYDKKNKLPYTINFTLSMQWQPSNDLAVSLGYIGNRGRHAVIPIPFNEPGIATPTSPIHGEPYSYGFQVLNQNSFTGYDYNAIANEPWNTEDGGNTDFRVPYVGYSPNAAFFETVGNSAYDALQAHLEKRLSHNFQVGASYTFSHTLDEQSDIGLFFTGDNPNDLRSSYASSDFDRTHIFSANFLVNTPNIAKAHSLLSYATNDWHLTGIGIIQSGQPYSLYEFYGAVGSIYFGDYPTLLNPVLPIHDASNPKRALTGNKGSVRGVGGSYIPTIDPSEIDIHYLNPGDKGIPVSTGTDPQDIYETDFAPGQRNLFRQSAQKRLDISARKEFQFSERFRFQYEFNAFNITNTTSLDIPQNQTEIRQSSACSNSAKLTEDNCSASAYYVNYGQIVTSNNAADQASAKTNLDQLPYHNGSGKSTSIPTTLPAGVLSCATATVTGGCPNNGANFGSVTGTIGGSRAITMGFHLLF